MNPELDLDKKSDLGAMPPKIFGIYSHFMP